MELIAKTSVHAYVSPVIKRFEEALSDGDITSKAKAGVRLAASFASFESFYWALFFRCFGGRMNGNVSIMRTMISKIVDVKRY